MLLQKEGKKSGSLQENLHHLLVLLQPKLPGQLQRKSYSQGSGIDADYICLVFINDVIALELSGVLYSFAPGPNSSGGEKH